MVAELVERGRERVEQVLAARVVLEPFLGELNDQDVVAGLDGLDDAREQGLQLRGHRR